MNTGTENDVVRQQSYECQGPVDLDIEVGAGLVEVGLAGDDAAPLVHVEVRHARDRGGMAAGLTGLLTLVGRFGGGDAADVPAQAVRETTIDMRDNRVTVRAPKTMPLSSVPLHVVVTAPAGSAVNLKVGSADATVSGAAGRCRLTAGSGNVTLERADGAAEVVTGSGSAHLGTVDGALAARAGSGDLQIELVGGDTNIVTGSGDVWIGIVRGSSLVARTGSGDVTIADAETGDLDLKTGSGNVRVGVHAGVTAELDLSTGSGRATSDLEVNRGPAPQDAEGLVRLRCRTGSGNAAVTRASA